MGAVLGVVWGFDAVFCIFTHLFAAQAAPIVRRQWTLTRADGTAPCLAAPQRGQAHASGSDASLPPRDGATLLLVGGAPGGGGVDSRTVDDGGSDPRTHSACLRAPRAPTGASISLFWRSTWVVATLPPCTWPSASRAASRWPSRCTTAASSRSSTSTRSSVRSASTAAWSTPTCCSW